MMKYKFTSAHFPGPSLPQGPCSCGQTDWRLPANKQHNSLLKSMANLNLGQCSKRPDILECVPLSVSSRYYSFWSCFDDHSWKWPTLTPPSDPLRGGPGYFKCKLSRSYAHQVISIAFSFWALHHCHAKIRSHAFLHIRRSLHSFSHVQLRLNMAKTGCTSPRPFKTDLLTFWLLVSP